MGGPFGVKRPLRYFAKQLELTESQVPAVAAILDDLRTERAQADVDKRRAAKLYAEAIGGESFDKKKADLAAKQRVESTEKVQAAFRDAIAELHELLEPAQRERFGLLIRSGPLSF